MAKIQILIIQIVGRGQLHDCYNEFEDNSLG